MSIASGSLLLESPALGPCVVAEWFLWCTAGSLLAVITREYTVSTCYVLCSVLSLLSALSSYMQLVFTLPHNFVALAGVTFWYKLRDFSGFAVHIPSLLGLRIFFDWRLSCAFCALRIAMTSTVFFIMHSHRS